MSFFFVGRVEATPLSRGCRHRLIRKAAMRPLLRTCRGPCVKGAVGRPLYRTNIVGVPEASEEDCAADVDPRVGGTTPVAEAAETLLASIQFVSQRCNVFNVRRCLRKDGRQRRLQRRCTRRVQEVERGTQRNNGAEITTISAETTCRSVACSTHLAVKDTQKVKRAS